MLQVRGSSAKLDHTNSMHFAREGGTLDKKTLQQMRVLHETSRHFNEFDVSKHLQMHKLFRRIISMHVSIFNVRHQHAFSKILMFAQKLRRRYGAITWIIIFGRCFVFAMRIKTQSDSGPTKPFAIQGVVETRNRYH